MNSSDMNKYISRLDKGDSVDELEDREEEVSRWLEFEELDEDYLEYLNDIDMSEDA